MEKQEEKMFFAAMALIGTIKNGETAPETAAKMAWIYAEAMLKYKPKEDNE
jgi:hypothetical protein